MSDDPLENKRKSDHNYWIHLVSLVLVAVFVPERYSILVFLAAIWMMLFEISERLRVHYYLHERTAESVERIARV
jgi:hypothetical protein